MIEIILTVIAVIVAIAIYKNCLKTDKDLTIANFPKTSTKRHFDLNDLNTNLESLIRSVMEMFKEQKTEGHQFAVVFLSSDKHLPGKMDFRTRDGVVGKDTWNQPTNSNSLTFPPKEKLYNYICARPDKSKSKNTGHTEMLLLDRLDELLDSYKSCCTSCCKSKCRIIVLYTWLLPCEECKDEIIKTLYESECYKKYQIVLAYTTGINYGANKKMKKKVKEELKAVKVREKGK